MGNKPKLKKNRGFSQKDPLPPIEDDPYWKVSLQYVDPNRLSRYVIRFYDYRDEHEEWVDNIIEGVPTYYCVLGVYRGATREQLQEAYEEHQNFSYYDKEILDEAFKTLSSPSLQKKYDDFLSVFEQVSKMLPPSEKRDLVSSHEENLSHAKQFAQIRKVRKEYSDYILLLCQGMPDIYEIAGLDRDCDIATIERDCPRDSVLFQRIFAILSDPVEREKFETILNFADECLSPECDDNRELKSELWDEYDPDIVEKVMLTALTEPSAIEEMFNRASKIFTSNDDWKDFVPPSDKTFYSILDIDPDLLRLEKKDVEGILRDKFRKIERTSEVNLAYSVLKNVSQREDYRWLYENSEVLHFLEKIIHEESPKMPDLDDLFSLDDFKKFLSMF